MTKLTLTNRDGEYSTSSVNDELDLTDICQLFNQLLKAAGYDFYGEVTIEDTKGGN